MNSRSSVAPALSSRYSDRLTLRKNYRKMMLRRKVAGCRFSRVPWLPSEGTKLVAATLRAVSDLALGRPRTGRMCPRLSITSRSSLPLLARCWIWLQASHAKNKVLLAFPVFPLAAPNHPRNLPKPTSDRPQTKPKLIPDRPWISPRPHLTLGFATPARP